MATPSKDYRYSVEFNIHAVDAPGTRLIKRGDIYINVCILGMHKRTRLMPATLPMHIDQKLFFEKVYKFCYDPEEILQRLEREHVLIELIQNDIPSPILLASFEAPAKTFLYPYSWDRLEYTGLRRYVLLNRTVEFPGISPSFEFSTSPYVDDVTGLTLSTTKIPRELKFTKRSASPTWKPASTYVTRPRLYNSANLSRSITSHTISSAIKSDHARPETKEKLRELNVGPEIDYGNDNSGNERPPFVVRHVNNDLIGRKADSHEVFRDTLVVKDHTLSRPLSSTSLYSFDDGFNRARSTSPTLGRSMSSMRGRARSQSPSRRSLKLSKSVDFENRERSLSPSRYLYNDYTGDNDIYASSPPRHLMSPTLLRDSFRNRYRYSPATDLSDKVIHTLRRNLSSYNTRPWPYYPASYRYSNGHLDDDYLFERSLQLTQD
ncbi:unnamed protein product [Rotaria magnacalcarata]|uniref:Spermatogenesis-associated protein 6 N-terminal domain-containing protein n=1 Tax=Rotaria magnacalcarata TaxID=392030 RepID=A0A816FTW1_9BILA|nr:unnamed protein product [Rotaria magnacalcarata]CAF1666118.1 unnamed protein product [Rotaria magnacalcarata]CAF4065782.1 unnamed protein product [Rotaria magnacalcarata]CAF4093808.1 unnamed protein product [Rotaria magnacalcarata]